MTLIPPQLFVGGFAGAYYGESGIPSSWLKQLVMKESIGEMAEQLAAVGKKQTTGK